MRRCTVNLMCCFNSSYRNEYEKEPRYGRKSLFACTVVLTNCRQLGLQCGIGRECWRNWRRRWRIKGIEGGEDKRHRWEEEVQKTVQKEELE